MDTQKIALSEHINYRFNPADLPKQTEETFLGWEYTLGQLSFSAIDELFPENNIFFLPLVQTSLRECSFVKNILSFYKGNIASFFDKILIDFPKEIESHLLKIQSSFPQNIFICEKNFVPQKYETINSSFLKLAKQNPVIFLESLDLRRMLLMNVDANKVVFFGDAISESNVYWKLFLKEQVFSKVKTSELLLENTLLPWVQLVFDQASYFLYTHKSLAQELQASCEKCLSSLMQNKEKKVLVVGGPLFLQCMAQYFTILKQQGVLESFLSKKNTIELGLFGQSFKKNTSSFTFFTLEETSATDFANICGFFAKDFVEKNFQGVKLKNFEYMNCDIFIRMSLTKAFLICKDRYHDWTKVNVTAQQEVDFFRYAYKLARANDKIIPEAFEFLLSARSVIDANFAFEFLKLCQDFPINHELSPHFPVVKYALDSFFNDTVKLSAQKFETIQSKKLFAKSKLVDVLKRKNLQNNDPVSEEKYQDNKWLEEDHPYSCSFPEEDIFMEKLSLDFRKTVKEKIKSSELVFRELQTDLGEGIDLRETIRHFYQEKIIIKEKQRSAKSDIGSVIFHFAEQANEHLYSWRSFWLAEQHDDSNLMFYATPYQQQIIGP
ncbi:MAG: hypothetical protein K2X39_10520, partial [Silvanigrellaceae bacterium]|nr:hypothetical protein [Silvanigrellaceae bacterium]